MIHRPVVLLGAGHHAHLPQPLDFRGRHDQLVVQGHVGDDDGGLAGAEAVGDVEVGGQAVAGVELGPELEGLHRGFGVQSGGDAPVLIELAAPLVNEHGEGGHAHADVGAHARTGVHQEAHVLFLQHRQILDHVLPRSRGYPGRGAGDPQLGENVRAIEHDRIGLLLRQAVHPAVEAQGRPGRSPGTGRSPSRNRQASATVFKSTAALRVA